MRAGPMGKSSADGIGGTSKRQTHNRMLTNQTKVYNAEDFINCAQQFAEKSQLFAVKREDMAPFEEMLQKRWQKIKTIPGTRSFHFFDPVDGERKIIAYVSACKDGPRMFKV